MPPALFFFLKIDLARWGSFDIPKLVLCIQLEKVGLIKHLQNSDLKETKALLGELAFLFLCLEM